MTPIVGMLPCFAPSHFVADPAKFRHSEYGFQNKH